MKNNIEIKSEEDIDNAVYGISKEILKNDGDGDNHTSKLGLAQDAIKKISAATKSDLNLYGKALYLLFDTLKEADDYKVNRVVVNELDSLIRKKDWSKASIYLEQLKKISYRASRRAMTGYSYNKKDEPDYTLTSILGCMAHRNAPQEVVRAWMEAFDECEDLEVCKNKQNLMEMYGEVVLFSSAPKFLKTLTEEAQDFYENKNWIAEVTHTVADYIEKEDHEGSPLDCKKFFNWLNFAKNNGVELSIEQMQAVMPEIYKRSLSSNQKIKLDRKWIDCAQAIEITIETLHLDYSGMQPDKNNSLKALGLNDLKSIYSEEEVQKNWDEHTDMWINLIHQTLLQSPHEQDCNAKRILFVLSDVLENVNVDPKRLLFPNLMEIDEWLEKGLLLAPGADAFLKAMHEVGVEIPDSWFNYPSKTILVLSEKSLSKQERIEEIDRLSRVALELSLRNKILDSSPPRQSPKFESRF